MAQLGDYLPQQLRVVQRSAWGEAAPSGPQPCVRTPAAPATGPSCRPSASNRPATPSPPSPGEPALQSVDACDDGWEDASHLLLDPGYNPAATAICPSPPAATAPPTPTLPLPIPLGRALKPKNDNSPSLAGWHMGATDADGNEAKCGAATKSASHSPTSVQAVFEGPATPDSSTAEALEELLAAMGIDDGSVAARTAEAVFSGWSSPVGSPPQDNNCYQWGSWGSTGALSEAGGASLGADLSAGTERHSQRASREERAQREAARQASNNAFARSRQLIGSMKEEASKAFQQAIDARRKGRLAEAAQFEREAQAWKCQAAAHREKAARDAYRRNNGGASVNHMPDVNLHDLDLEVSQALKKVRSAVDAAMKLAGDGVYSLVTVAFIPGWGKHSPTGEGKILPAIQDLLDSLGIDFQMPNAGKIQALFPADAY